MSPETQPMSVHNQLIRNVEARSPHDAIRTLKVGGALAGIGIVGLAAGVLPGSGDLIPRVAAAEPTPVTGATNPSDVVVTTPGAPDAAFNTPARVIATTPGFRTESSEPTQKKPGPETNLGASTTFGSYLELPDSASDASRGRAIDVIDKSIKGQYDSVSRGIVSVRPYVLAKLNPRQLAAKKKAPGYAVIDPSASRTQTFVDGISTMIKNNDFDGKYRVKLLGPTEIVAAENGAFRSKLRAVAKRQSKATGKKQTLQSTYARFLNGALPRNEQNLLDKTYAANSSGDSAGVESYTDDPN